MMRDGSRWDGRRLRLTVEALEQRAVLSKLGHAAAYVPDGFEIQRSAGNEVLPPVFNGGLPISAVLSQQADSGSFTVARSSGAGRAHVVVQTRYETDGPYVAIVGNQAVPGKNYTPIDVTLTFAPGERFKTVTIPIIRGAPNPGALNIEIVMPRDHVHAPDTYRWIELINRADVTGPHLVSSRLVTSGNISTGVALTFDEPLDPARAQNLSFYGGRLQQTRYSARAGASALFTGLFVDPFGVRSRSHGTPRSDTFTFGAASYDPATHTVVLTTRHPFRLRPGTVMYVFGNDYNVAANSLTDLAGNPAKSFLLAFDGKHPEGRDVNARKG
jgi:hypothetical protein